MAIAVVAAGLLVWNNPTREQRAMASLVNTRANVMLFDAMDGAKFIDVDLHGCDNNDEPLTFVSDIENVQGLHLNSVPVQERGVESLRRIRGLRYLDISSTFFPTVDPTELKDELRRNNPNLEIDSGETIKRVSSGQSK
jgi:hypothetical protein